MFSLKKSRTKICHCSLNQSAMDFENNKRRIIESLEFAIKNDCAIRTGGELEVPGYSCDDHFKEIDLYSHCWETVGDIIKGGYTENIVVDLGMPVLHRTLAYNCKVIIFRNKIMLIRPKFHLADEGNYREKRYFMPYKPNETFSLETHHLPDHIKQITGQELSPFGYANLKFNDALVGLEICEEIWRLNSISRNSYLECDLIMCANGSHFERRKLEKRYNLMSENMSKAVGTYIYCNLSGFDGSSVYFDGGNLVVGQEGLIQLGEYCSMREVNCMAVVIDLAESREEKLGDVCHMDEANRGIHPVPEITMDFSISVSNCDKTPVIDTKDIFIPYEKQYLLASSSYLWDYIRKSGASGVFLPLSGGADSGLTAMIVKVMANRLFNYYTEGAEDVIKHLRKVTGEDDFAPKSPEDIIKRVLFTAYMGSKNSSTETRKRARDLAAHLQCEHTEIEIDDIVGEFEAAIKKAFDIKLQFEVNGGTWQEDIALQNVYARVRMVLSYLLAQVLPLKFKRKGFFLTLACGNLDETLIGYYTKYDCSSGDINLIGSMSKQDIMATLKYLSEDPVYKDDSIRKIFEAKPSADLKPAIANQSDEEEIGLSFKEIHEFAAARTVRNCSVISFYKTVESIFPQLTKKSLFEKVEKFFKMYSINRHKVEVLTTSLHLSSKSCSSKRFDLRPIIYENKFSYELRKLKEMLDQDM